MTKNWLNAIAGTIFFTIVITLAVGALSYLSQNDQADDLGPDCLDWLHKDSAARYIDGPDMAKLCTDYFQKRTPAQVKADDWYWNALIKDAQKDWDAPRGKDRP